MSFSKRHRSPGGEGKVTYSVSSTGEAVCSVDVVSRHSEGTLEGDVREDGYLSDVETGDKETLLAQEDEIDSNGVVREYEVALKHLGFGFFHIFLLLMNGVALLSDSIEILSISFVLPVLGDRDEFGAGDVEGAILGSSIFVGMLFGSYTWGGLADVIGRRATIVWSLGISALFGFASAFAPWFWLFVLLRLCSGFGVGGSLPVIGPYIAEFVQNKYRGPYLSIQTTFWTFGRVLCGGLAWIIIPLGKIDAPIGNFRFHSWRLFIAISALPSLIGVVLYWLLPESPRFLLEVGKQKKAMKGLQFAHKLNHLGQGKTYPVKRIHLEGIHDSTQVRFKNSRLQAILARIKEVTGRTSELFRREYLRRTSLLMVIMFCLAFGSYGVTLWFPTYVSGITARTNAEKFEKFCSVDYNHTSGASVQSYCDCSQTVFANFALTDLELKNFRVNDVIFKNVSFNNVSFESVVFNSTQFVDCQFNKVNISQSYFNSTLFDDILFKSVAIRSSSLCSVESLVVTVTDSSVTLQDVDLNGQTVSCKACNSSTLEDLLLLNKTDGRCSESSLLKEIQCKPPDNRVYKDTFFISASSVPGNIVSAFAVYFFRRNYWMAVSLLLATISVFLLYTVSSEAYVVVMLCIFNGITTTSWNDSGLLMAELYPTRLRSTAAGMHLLLARIGAIVGTNLFGLFIRVNPSVPILLVAGVLLTGSVASIGLPKTTRNTLLK